MSEQQKDRNEVTLLGEICDDIEVRYSQGGTAFTKVTVKTATSKKSTYHRCTAFGEVATAAGDFKKGNRVQIVGRLQSGSYEKDGKKVYTYEVIVENISDVDNAPPKGKKLQKVEDDDIPF